MIPKYIFNKFRKYLSPDNIIIKIILTLCFCLFFEGVCLNYGAISTRHLKSFEIKISDVKKNVQYHEIKELNLENIETIRVSFSGTKTITKVNIDFKDDTRKEGYINADTGILSPGSTIFNKLILRVKSHGTLYALKLSWDQKDAHLERVEANVPISYSFHQERFLVILILCLITLIIRHYELWRIPCNYTEKKSVICYLSMVIICILMSIHLNILLEPDDRNRFIYTQRIEYPFVRDVSSYAGLVHAVMFDSLYHGVPYVRIIPDKGLRDLKNPYDPTQRSANKVSSLWDYALYNGEIYSYYYSYFGLTPVLVFYVPFYFINGVLPSYTDCALFFSILTIISGFLCIWEMSKRWIKNASLYIFCISSTACVLGTNALMIQSCADRYYISFASTQSFFFLTVWAIVRGINNSGKCRKFYFIVGAIFTFLLVWSRPSGAIAAFGWITPLFILLFCDKNKTLRQKRNDLLAYIVPSILFAFIVMSYNVIRFHSPFNFGQIFQLTVSDIRSLSFSLANTGKAIWHYYCNFPIIYPDFPWFRGVNNFINHSGNYFYGATSVGILTMPITWSIIIFGLSSINREGKVVLFVAFISCLVISVLDYSLAGIHWRYQCDILPSSCLIGVLLVVDHSRFCNEKERNISIRIISTISAITCLIAICLAFHNERNFISIYNPDGYLKFVQLLSIR